MEIGNAAGLDLTGVTFSKSSFSLEENCVEVGFADGGVVLRDSKDKTGPVLTFTPREWEAFAAGMKDGQFDQA